MSHEHELFYTVKQLSCLDDKHLEIVAENEVGMRAVLVYPLIGEDSGELRIGSKLKLSVDKL
jgi:hypothetical protein